MLNTSEGLLLKTPFLIENNLAPSNSLMAFVFKSNELQIEMVSFLPKLNECLYPLGLPKVPNVKKLKKESIIIES
jgi:hypothetical protein